MLPKDPFRARVERRDLKGGKEHLLALLDDGRHFSDPSAYGLARQLHAAGITASQVYMPDWREGGTAPGNGQKIRLYHCLRQWERGQEPLDDDALYGPT